MGEQVGQAAGEGRGRVLVRVLGQRGAEGRELLKRHPNPPRAGDGTDGARLPDLLWGDLRAMEMKGQGRAGGRAGGAVHLGPVQYYLRRRKLLRMEEWMRLPAHWRQLLQLPAEDLQGCCLELGISVAAWAGWDRAAGQLLELLEPLESQLARRVADRIRALPRPPCPAGLSGRCVKRYLQTVSVRRGAGLAEALGRCLLAGLFRRLSSEQAELAAEMSRSNLCDLLLQAAPIELGGVEEIELVERAVGEVLRNHLPGGAGRFESHE